MGLPASPAPRRGFLLHPFRRPASAAKAHRMIPGRNRPGASIVSVQTVEAPACAGAMDGGTASD